MKWRIGLPAFLVVGILMLSWTVPNVEAAGSVHIVINKTTNQLKLYQHGTLRKVYPVATGKTESQTPEGTFQLITKFIKPGWKNIPGGVPENPLGERWLGLKVKGDQGRTYGIHGTNRPASVGTYVSNGCVRMYNRDVRELYRLVPEGTRVTIHKEQEREVWKPASGKIKVTVSTARIRSNPSLQSGVVDTATEGTILSLIRSSDSWFQVQLPKGKTGYIHTSVGALLR